MLVEWLISARADTEKRLWGVVEELGLEPDDEARAYLDELIQRAADAVDGPDPLNVDEAEANLRMVLVATAPQLDVLELTRANRRPLQRDELEAAVELRCKWWPICRGGPSPDDEDAVTLPRTPAGRGA